MEKETKDKPKKGREGIPCSPASLKAQLKAFSDMEDAINELYKKKKKSYTKK